MAVITTVAESVEECAALSSMRTVFGFLSGVYIYAIAWGLLGQDSEVTLGPNSLSDFMYLSWIAAGTGVFFATLFLIGTKEPQKPVRRKSILTGIMRAPEIIVMPQFGRESAGKGSSQVDLAHRFVDMIMVSSQVETYQHEHNGHEENQTHEPRERRKSLLHKFAAALFSDGENKTGLTLSVPDPEEGTKNPDRSHRLFPNYSSDQRLFFKFNLQRTQQEDWKQELIGENKETSGSVFAIISVISRLSSGGLIIGIQKFYPEERTSSNGEVSNYVRHVFAMAPGILTL
ncbi:hypothetical protein AWC38_SpisGene24120, partial [Stylophora pistillata]